MDFLTMDRQTVQAVPLWDFKTTDFRTVTGDENHTRINKK